MQLQDVLVSIPHAGTAIPNDIRARMVPSDESLLREPDLYTDRIYSILGPRVVTHPWSRIIGDCNRAPDEIYTEGRKRASGVIMLSECDGNSVFEQDPSITEMEDWVNRFQRPYHTLLEKEVHTASFLIDGHSMASVGAPGHIDPGNVRADIDIANREYCSCSAETTLFFVEYFRACGYSVTINSPYTGRYILGTYCSRLGLPGLQIEINRKVYMDERTLEPNEAAITRLRQEFSVLVSRFCEWFQGRPLPREKPMTDLSERHA